jgi:hypothetical protein
MFAHTGLVVSPYCSWQSMADWQARPYPWELRNMFVIASFSCYTAEASRPRPRPCRNSREHLPCHQRKQLSIPLRRYVVPFSSYYISSSASLSHPHIDQTSAFGFGTILLRATPYLNTNLSSVPALRVQTNRLAGHTSESAPCETHHDALATMSLAGSRQ